MKKIIAAILLTVSGPVAAEPTVLRASENEYALVGEGHVSTKDCTVTAEGTLSARIERKGKKLWLLFIDRDGEEEAQCEVLATLSRPRKVELLAVRR